MCSICTDGAFEAVTSVCALWFLDQQIEGRQEKSSYTAGGQAAWLAVLHKNLVCGLCIMEKSISLAHTDTHTHTSPFPRQEVQAMYNHEGHRSSLFAMWSEACIVPSYVGVCLCSRVSNISSDCGHMQVWLYWLSQDSKSVVKPCAGLLVAANLWRRERGGCYHIISV